MYSNFIINVSGGSDRHEVVYIGETIALPLDMKPERDLISEGIYIIHNQLYNHFEAYIDMRTAILLDGFHFIKPYIKAALVQKRDSLINEVLHYE